jgi:heme/copper-type cytochrome/quinol oxidase subunit 2
MKLQNSVYWTIITFILIVAASIFSFYYIYNIKNNLGGENIQTINCQQLKNLYDKSFREIIDIKVFLSENCTINGITIPSGYRIIYIYNGSIHYI